jgi:ubiquitin-conjugating enzyme E2 Z
MDQKIFIKKETIQRLIKDVKQIKKEPLTTENIYYHHDEENVLKGYALIIGPEGTPYFGGYYLFILDFPEDYPHTPPKVTFVTNGDGIRFNPNLYVDGKVCISLLNTWKGEQWTSCQTISTILLTLGTLLCNNPLLNEPGIHTTHIDFHKYTKIIEYKNIDVAILNILNRHKYSYYSQYTFIQNFDTIMKEKFLENKEKLKLFVNEKRKESPPEFIKTTIYYMTVWIDYNRLYDKIDLQIKE